MNIKDIISKILKGVALTEEEKTSLAAYDPDAEQSELKEKIEQLENAGKTEAEKAAAAHTKEITALKKQLDTLTKERDEAKAGLAKSERAAKIAALASKHAFRNSEYLDFLTNTRKLDLNDEKATGAFFGELAKSNPELFASTVKPGGGTFIGGNTGAGNDIKTRLNELMKKPELSPREAGEVIAIQEKLKSENK